MMDGAVPETVSWEDCRRQSRDEAVTTETPQGTSEIEAGDELSSKKAARTSREPKTGKEVVPGWDGTSTSFRDYKRRVSLFLATTGIDEEYRGGRLVEQLTSTAWRATETLDMSLLRAADGVDVLLTHLQNEIEPVEHLKVFGTLAAFFKNFRRERGQEFIEFDTSFRVQCQKLEEVGAGLTGLIKSYWFLECAAISEDLRKQVISAAQGSYQYEKLRAALIAIVPRVKKESNEEGNRAHRFNAQNRKASPHPNRYPPKSDKAGPHQVNVVGEDADPGQDDGEEHEPNDEQESDTPPEEMELQAQIMMTEAARKRASIEKARGYSKPKPKENGDERQKRISQMKSNMACSACRAHGRVVFGHWHQDPECPFYNKDKDKGKSSAGVFAVQTDDEDDSDDVFTPDVNSVLMTIAKDDTKEPWKKIDIALSDTCCSRTVAGSPWMARCLRRLWNHGIMFYVVKEKQAFKFGPGPKKWSTSAVIIPTSLHDPDRRVYLRISVVKDDVPLLVSHRALTDLGAVLNLPEHSMELGTLGKKYPLLQTRSGHVGFPIWDYEMETMMKQCDDDLWMHCCENDDEIKLVPHRTPGHGAADMDSMGYSYSSVMVADSHGTSSPLLAGFTPQA